MLAAARPRTSSALPRASPPSPSPQRALGLPFVASYQPHEAADLHCHVDFVVCLGGDGLLLHAAGLFGPALPPIISFKLGSLGFLTAHE